MSLQSLALRFWPGLRASSVRPHQVQWDYFPVVCLFFFLFRRMALPLSESVCISLSLFLPPSVLSLPVRVGIQTHTLLQRYFIQHIFWKLPTNKWLVLSRVFEYQAALFPELETPRVNYSSWYVFITSSWEYKWDQASFTSVLIQFGRQLLPALGFQVFFCRLSLLTTLYWTLKCFVFTFVISPLMGAVRRL